MDEDIPKKKDVDGGKIAPLHMTAYEILDIKVNATDSEIKQTFRKFALKYHPDYYKGDDDEFNRIKKAYESIKTQQLRNSYNRKLELAQKFAQRSLMKG